MFCAEGSRKVIPMVTTHGKCAILFFFTLVHIAEREHYDDRCCAQEINVYISASKLADLFRV